MSELDISNIDNHRELEFSQDEHSLSSITPETNPTPPHIGFHLSPLNEPQAGTASVIDHLQESALPQEIPTQPQAELRGRVRLHPKPVVGLINLAKITWAVPWTILRFAVAIAFLPIAYPIYLIIQKFDRSTLGTERVNQAAQQSLNELQQAAANAPATLAQPQEEKALRQEAAELERLKDASRGNAETRAAFFDHYSQHVETIFSTAGTQTYLGDIQETLEQDYNLAEAVELSRESYINLNLVYRFDGHDMVGREISLMHRTEDGAEHKVRYQVQRYFEDPHGLVGYGLIPVGNNEHGAPPRLIFRGTTKAHYIRANGERVEMPTGFRTDLAGKIGKIPYLRQRDQILEWLETATAATGQQAFVSGHSLGGALAQRVAADRPSLVGKIFTKGSPMLEAGAIDERTDRRHIKVIHDVDTGDLMVPKVGGGRLGALNRGRHFSSGNENTQEVFVRRGGGHTSKMGNDLCMRGKFFHYKKLTHSRWQSRNGFFSDLFNFVRPRINLV